VYLAHQPDGGEIQINNGLIRRDLGFSTAVYLSLYGGNVDDDGSPAAQSKQWWGNLLEEGASFQYRSQTQALLRTLPATTANLSRIQEAAQQDLAWLLDSYADQLTVTVALTGVRRVEIRVEIRVGQEVSRLRFAQFWGLTS
jgi:Phage protein GP46.